MAHLTLAGVSEDGKRLLLVDDAGVEHTLDIDGSLRAALRGDTARIGQLEIKMESTLRPRDIQARIRAGETPESVAQAAQTSVERIMPFAGPVIAERQHVAQRAQRSSVRRRSGESSGSARMLGDVVAAQLRAVNTDPETVEWDAWRREDGRWTLTALYETSARTGTAQFTYDTLGNYVVLDNDDARWLTGDLVEPAAAATATPRDDLERARQRRQSSRSDVEELPLGDDLGSDAIELVRDEPVTEDPVEALLDDRPDRDPAAEAEERRQAEQAADAAARDQDPAPRPADDAPPVRRPVKKTRGRASVPSWDEIMFGGGKSD